MSLALPGIQIKIDELMEVIYPRLEDVTQTLRDVSSRFTPIATVALSNLQKILYSDLAEIYLSIALATWILSTTALLSFWFGWTLGVNLYRLGVWLTRSAPRRQHRPRIAKGVSVSKVELAGGLHSVKAEVDVAPQASGGTATCKETSCVAHTAAAGPKHISSASPVPENNVADAEITTASVIKAGTPDYGEHGHDASALSIPVRITRNGKYATPAPTGGAGDLVGLVTPPVSQVAFVISRTPWHHAMNPYLRLCFSS